jgi:hypothetical protein
MALSVFDDKESEPQEEELWRALGRSSRSWQSLTNWLADRYRPLEDEWVFYAKKWGWSLRLRHKKRTVLYLTPCNKHFLVGFVLGEKAVAEALEMKLPESLAQQIETARRYVEGRAIRLEVRQKKDLEAIEQLARAKMAN